MKRTKQDVKDELANRIDEIHKRVKEIFGDHIRDIDFDYIPLFTFLLQYEMNHKPAEPGWIGRDRLLVSNLRMVPSLLAVMADVGYINWKDFNQLVRKLPHFFTNPNVTLTNYPGVDLIANDMPYLGMVQSIGYALSARNSRYDYRVYHVLTDRRTAAMQETLMTASAENAGNLTCLIPYMEMQKRSGSLHFWFSMGWDLQEARFEEVGSIFEAMARAHRSKDKPQIILG